MFTRDEVLEANIKLHGFFADKYKNMEPHYRPENIARMHGIIENIQKKSGGKSLLDVGCGIGFIIDIAKNYFEIVRGIDITPEMLKKVNVNSSKCNIEVQIADSNEIPFADHHFDVCTCYAVLHHLYDIEATLYEIFRVLKPGGYFYSGLDPNYYFWDTMNKIPFDDDYNKIVMKELNSVKHKVDEISEEFNIDKDLLYKAENLKHIYGGFKEEELCILLKNIGFSHYRIEYDWFLGEGNLINDELKKDRVGILREYLREILPISNNLFKYLSIHAIK